MDQATQQCNSIELDCEDVYTNIIQVFEEMKTNIPDQNIIKMLEYLSRHYNNKPGIGVLRPLEIAEGEQSEYHCAKLYRYSACITRSTQYFWGKHFQNIRELSGPECPDFALKRLAIENITTNARTKNIACIGEPLSDLIGFHLFVKENNINMILNAATLDNENWSIENAKILDRFNARTIITDSQVLRFDFFNDVIPPIVRTALRTADFISLSKYLSYVSHEIQWGDPCSNGIEKLKNLFDVFKSGSLIHSMENSGGLYAETFSDVAQQKGLVLLSQEKSKNIVTRIPREIIENYKIGEQNPLKHLGVTSTLWIKP